jgi:hypothetical protein
MAFWGAFKGALSSLGKEGAKSSWKSELLRTGAQIAGSLAKGREAGRATENAGALTQDNQRLVAQRDYEGSLEDRAKLDLDRKRFTSDEENRAYKNALHSALVLNIKDVLANRPEGVPTIAFSGGLRPSALGDDARKAAEIMNARSLVSLMDGTGFDTLPDIERFTPTEQKQGGTWDTILGAAGTVGSAVDQLEAGRQQNEQTSMIRKMIDAAQQSAQQGIAPPPSPATDFRDPRKLFY